MLRRGGTHRPRRAVQPLHKGGRLSANGQVRGGPAVLRRRPEPGSRVSGRPRLAGGGSLKDGREIPRISRLTRCPEGRRRVAVLGARRVRDEPGAADGRSARILRGAQTVPPAGPGAACAFVWTVTGNNRRQTGTRRALPATRSLRKLRSPRALLPCTRPSRCRRPPTSGTSPGGWTSW